ncbi:MULTISPECIES: DUF2069 domain-containing protein [unclassified Modicisalibacter]|uniref:DUF2069 domain-containing protein n=1 Tax=unclassified Modicisalibacter TaxID=2679913 RepID=UPI001CCF7164|nr:MULTISPECIES: DUF2069 domain-containing protein [unclassified Modicisalibacter]MBZ9556674.1 DUF2069 domain-containing protein [Modicisalibacter sp. R2A 31.J]MBZ9574857.1 DUF2069 domain-containing protein [Modicisalibacter sp. MOD 31.J]
MTGDTATPATRQDQRLRQARRVVIGSYAALIVLLCLGGWLLKSQHQVGWGPILVRLLPLVLLLPSLLTRRPRGHLWLAFVSLLYLMQGVMIASLPDKLWLGGLEIAAAAVLCVASALYARWRGRQLRS